MNTTGYMFSGPGGRIEFWAEPTAARQILQALLGHWSKDRVMFGLLDGEKYQIEADTQESHALVREITQ